MRQQVLWELFDLSNQFMKDLDIEYWVNFGTLLGFYRENGIIAHDIDIDFGCHERYYELILENQAKLPAELNLHDTSNRHNGPKLYMSYKGFDADIYFYREEDGQFHSYEKTHWENDKAPIPVQQVIPTKTITIKGMETQLPNDPEAYLKTIYGSLRSDAIRNPKTGYWE